ncbi:MAG: hypothetical protein CMN34_06055 [Saprospirales bacterium]|jgi:hypothetical protein|nr:hypothetical protein [Saprospirales bacterium]|tara:strand:+ start:2113 stop:2334 length:222 start_codon:yes stop_codon:yes gene_type:complete
MSKRTVHGPQLLTFISKIEKNLEDFNFYDANSSKEDKMAYIRYQRELFDIAERVLAGSLYFVGTSQEIRETKS